MDYENNPVFDKSDAPESFPLMPGPKGKGGADEEHMFLSNPYINHYAIPSINPKELFAENGLGRYLFGDRYLHCHSLSDFLFDFSFYHGYFRGNDLSYYLGIDNKVLSKNLSMLSKSGMIRKIEGPSSFQGNIYYIFHSDCPPAKERKQRKIVSPVSLAYRPVGSGYAFHAYGIGLSELLLSLYGARGNYAFFHNREYPIGNYYDAESKKTSIISTDSLCVVKSKVFGEEHTEYLCQEFDTGSERYGKLLEKFSDYYQTSFYSTKNMVSYSLVFSYLPPDVAAYGTILSTGMAQDSYFNYFYYLSFVYVVSTFEPVPDMTGNIDKEEAGLCNIAPFVMNSDCFYGFLKRLAALEEFPRHVMFIKALKLMPDSHIRILGDDCLLDTVSFIKNLSTQDKKELAKVRELFLGLCALFPDQVSDPRLYPLTIHNLNEFLLYYKKVKQGEFLRIFYNKAVDKQCMARRYGLLAAILKQMRGITSKNADKFEHMLKEEGFGRKNRSLPFYPLLFGFRCYFVSAHTLTNHLPFLLWDRTSYYIERLESAIKSFFGEDMIFLNPGDIHYVYQKDKPENIEESAMRGIYNMDFQLAGFLYAYHSMGKNLTVYVDDLSGNLSAALKVISSASAFTDTTDKVYLLLSNSPDEVIYFYRKFLDQSARCNQDKDTAYCPDFIPYEIPSAINATGKIVRISFADWIRLPVTHVMFTKKFYSPTDKLFFYSVSSNGKIYEIFSDF